MPIFFSFIYISSPKKPFDPSFCPLQIAPGSYHGLFLSPGPPRRMVVVGADIIGPCTVFFLTKRLSTTSSSSSDYRVMLVEQSTAIANAASGKAVGFLTLDWCDGGPVQELARANFALNCSLAEELAGARSCGYRPATTHSIPVAESDSSSSSRGNRDDFPVWVNGLRRPRKRPRTIGTMENTAQVHSVH